MLFLIVLIMGAEIVKGQDYSFTIDVPNDKKCKNNIVIINNTLSGSIGIY